MSGYELIKRVKSLEERIHAMGFRWGYERNGWSQDNGDKVAIYPRDEELPVFSRDAELFVGTLTELECWLRGIEWSRKYDLLLKVSDGKKRERKEQDQRNVNLVKRLKLEKIDEVS